jgi:Brp/Blh family beta-carotene 15,15'-monooxygenase
MSTVGAPLRDAFDVEGPRSTTLAVTLSRGVLLALTVGFAAAAVAGVRLAPRTQYGIYLLGMVALNLPHGGYEHFSNLKTRGVAFGWRYVAAYLGGIAAFVALLVVAPVVGLTLAIGVAVVKGGNGGLHVLDVTTGTGHLRTRAQRALAVGVRGGAVMAVPIVAWPDTFHTFSAYMINVFEMGGLAPLSAYFDVTRPLIGGGFALATLAHLGGGFVRSAGDADARRSWLADAAETLLLVAYFVAVPVVVAVGLYFPFWYSVRQVARTTAVGDDGDDVGTGLFGVTDPTRVALLAWGILMIGAVATAAVVGGIYVLAPNPFGGAPPLAGAVAFWSICISVIALPHVVVGSWYDRERGIWYVPGE